MAELKCEVLKVSIKEHPNADALEIAQVRGYDSIVRKGQFQTGDLAVYIPEQSIVPEWLLRNLNLWDDDKGKGKLAGSNGDRVKAIKLRGVTSQGLLYPLNTHGWDSFPVLIDESGNTHNITDGDDVTELLGVTKWEPEIPIHMAGEVTSLAGKTLKYDIENIKNYPEIADALMNLNIDVHITEKLHGTWMCIGIYPEHISDEITEGRIFVTSKGLSAKGLVFKDNEANENNVYMRAFKRICSSDGMLESLLKLPNGDAPIFLVGELFGKGVQDLHYGNEVPSFRIFDVYEGLPSMGKYLTPAIVLQLLNAYRIYIPTAPILYEGKLTQEVIEEHTNGKDSISDSHVREGIVIRTLRSEYRNDKIGRVILKSVSDAYLQRKNGTEFN